MAAPLPSALSRTYSGLGAFLRHTWISRVNLSDWLKGWAFGRSKLRRCSQKPQWGQQLGVESFEARGSPDDVLGILQSGWLGPGGTLLTPGLALLRGWA